MTAKWKGAIQWKNEGSSSGSAVLGRMVASGIRESRVGGGDLSSP